MRARLYDILSPAHQLAKMGLNIFPLPYGEKVPKIPFKKWGITNTPLNPADFGFIFPQRTNIAVITGRTSGNLFVIDADEPAAFEAHLQQMRQRDLPIFAVRTSRGGHIYLRAATKAPPTMRLIDGDLKGGDDGYVIAPPSLHPSGVFYRWYECNTADAPPVVDLAKINWLQTPEGQPIRLQRNRLADLTLNFIRQGAAEGARNTTLYRAAHDMGMKGASLSEALQKLAPAAENSGLSHNETRRTIENGWQDGQQHKRTPPRYHERIVAWVEAAHWRGRAGATDKAVMLALVERSKLDDCGKGSFRASVRELAELAHINAKTAQRSVKRLQDVGLICKVGYTDMGANKFSFTDALLAAVKTIDIGEVITRHNDYSKSKALKGFNTVPIVLSLEAALGIPAAKVLDYLQRTFNPQTIRTIATACTLSLSQTRYALKKLRVIGLILMQKSKYSYQHNQQALIDVIERGTKKITNARRKHINERQARAARKIIDRIANARP